MRKNSIPRTGTGGNPKNIRIHSEDRRNFVMVPNSIVRGGHKPQFLAVLFAIASHAGEGECFASAPTISEEVGVKRDTVFKAIKYWEELGHIAVVRETGLPTSIVTRFDFVGDTRPPSGTGTRPQVATGSEDTRPQNGTTPVPEEGLPPVPQTGHKEEPMKKNHEEDTTTGGGADASPSQEENKQVAEVMEVFVKSINPELSYGHKGERSAALRLIRTGGLMPTLAAARFAIQVLPDRFAPTCTKPSELERNLPKLRAYKAKLQNQAPGGKDSTIAFVS